MLDIQSTEQVSIPMSTSPTSIGLARHLESDKLMIYCSVSESVESIPCMNNCGIDKELGYVALHIQSAEHDSLITLSLLLLIIWVDLGSI